MLQLPKLAWDEDVNPGSRQSQGESNLESRSSANGDAGAVAFPKIQAAAIWFPPALKAVVLCGFIFGSAIGYVWQKNRLGELGQRIHEKEDQLVRLRDANDGFAMQLRMLQSRAYLERRVRELNLDLAKPQESQILVIIEAPSGLPPKTEK